MSFIEFSVGVQNNKENTECSPRRGMAKAKGHKYTTQNQTYKIRQQLFSLECTSWAANKEHIKRNNTH